jgi:hypothetical protein
MPNERVLVLEKIQHNKQPDFVNLVEFFRAEQLLKAACQLPEDAKLSNRNLFLLMIAPK